MYDDVGDVAVHEELAGQQPHDLVGGHAAVGAADPEVVGGLLPDQRLEEGGIACLDLIGPATVALEERAQASHRGASGAADASDGSGRSVRTKKSRIVR